MELMELIKEVIEIKRCIAYLLFHNSGFFFIDHPWRVLALVLLFAVYYLAFCACGAYVYKKAGRLNRRAIPGILLLPVFMASWMPCSIWACLTPPPRWKEIRHDRSLHEPDILE